MNGNCEEVAELFREVRGAFPGLRMDLQLQHPVFDLSLDIPQQPGLAFFVNLNLQGTSFT